MTLTVLRGVEVRTYDFVSCTVIFRVYEFSNVDEGFLFDCEYFEVCGDFETFRFDVLTARPQNVFFVDCQVHATAFLKHSNCDNFSQTIGIWWYPIEVELPDSYLSPFLLYVYNVVLGVNPVTLIIESHLPGLPIEQNLLLNKVEKVASGFPNLTRIVAIFGGFGYLFSLV